MDERIGREVASHFGIKYIGLIGILVGAKNKGEIKSIRSSLDMLRYKAGFFISGKLYNKILTDAGEAA
jgi:predicted nucleic acid-binding protein